MLDITQQQMANVLCMALITLGAIVGGLSVFKIEGMDSDKAERLGTFFFTNGVTLGFGVQIDNLVKKKRKEEGGRGQEGMDGEDGIEGVDWEDWGAESFDSFYEEGREGKGD